MLIALAAVAVASPILVNISATSDVSPSVLRLMVAEADAIWRPTGVTFEWQPAPRAANEELHVIVDHERGVSTGALEPLGWVIFDAAQGPLHDIHISYENAVALLEQSGGALGPVGRMPIRQRETYLGRAMGRALAHEIGHYLMQSKTHSKRGLMQANRSALQFFATERPSFQIDPVDLMIVTAKPGWGPHPASDQDH